VLKTWGHTFYTRIPGRYDPVLSKAELTMIPP